MVQQMSANFSDFQFPENLAQTLERIGYQTPTPVQSAAMPLVLEGHDILASAQTGTGKTAAFALPLLSKMVKNEIKTSVLILTPTRELAEQIYGVLNQFTERLRQFKPALVIGGASQFFQNKMLRQRPRFVVATPGRLLDHVQMKTFNPQDYGVVVLDEADRMLDMGFEYQLNEILRRLPVPRQTLLFSATLPEEILKIAQRYQRNPKRIAVGGPQSKPAALVEQRSVQTTAQGKKETLIQEIDKVAGTILIFTRTKSRTEAVTKQLRAAGHEVTRIHGDRSQRQRSEAIAGFRKGQFRILVATDIAARGLDISHIEHVINYDLPMCAEDYIHRIGRTGRNGKEGQSLSLLTPEDSGQWNRIQRLMYGKNAPQLPRQGKGRPNQGRPGQNRPGQPKRRGKFRRHRPQNNRPQSSPQWGS